MAFRNNVIDQHVIDQHVINQTLIEQYFIDPSFIDQHCFGQNPGKAGCTERTRDRVHDIEHKFADNRPDVYQHVTEHHSIDQA